MKAMFLSDLLIAKKYLVQQLLVGVAAGVFMGIVMGNIYVIPPAIGVMIPFSLAFTILSFDERANWQQFRLSLPLSRRGVILGRYASLAVIALASLVIGLVTMGIVIAAATLMPSVPQFADLLVNFSWQAIVFVSVVAIAIILAMLSTIMPLVSRFGMTKAVRYIPLLFILVLLLVFNLEGNSAAPEFLVRLATWAQTPAGTLGIAGIILAATCALYALSGALSMKLYKKREF